MQDLKDEGNILFKECHYDIAWMHYRNALFIARILSTRFYHEVDKEFLSTLFSNRAFCCLKKVSIYLVLVVFLLLLELIDRNASHAWTCHQVVLFGTEENS